MANRTATYFGFDGLGEADPAKSDFRYYVTVQGWAAGKHIDFTYTDSHDKAGAVRDTSLLSTLQASIRTRLNASKNMVVILSNDTRKSGSVLSYEIEKAVDIYKLPLIIAHTGIPYLTDPSAYSFRWPTSLETRLMSGAAKAIHIPFKKEAILNAIERFTVNGEKLDGSFKYYTYEAQVQWGFTS